jgi:hypothetical protein
VKLFSCTLGEGANQLKVPISTAIICISLVLAFSKSAFLSAFTSLIWTIISYPVNAGLTWVLTRTGLYTLSQELAARADALKERDRKKTAMMKANAMREKIEAKGLKDMHGLKQLRGMMELGLKDVEGVESTEVLEKGKGKWMKDLNGMKQLKGMREWSRAEGGGVELGEVSGKGKGKWKIVSDVESGQSSGSESRIYSPRL